MSKFALKRKANICFKNVTENTDIRIGHAFTCIVGTESGSSRHSEYLQE